jgi:hypothetical protein
MAFLQLYKQKRGCIDETQYNIARALQLQGLNIAAASLYEKLVGCSNIEIKTRAIFNLS